MENIDDLIKNTTILSILAIGMMLVIITRGIDLSIGATIALSGMISALTIGANKNLHPVLVILLGIFVGLVCGCILGILVSKAKFYLYRVTWYDECLQRINLHGQWRKMGKRTSDAGKL